MSTYVERIPSSGFTLWSKGPRLASIDVELTERCNNNCIHCCINLPADEKAARENELNAPELTRILTEAAHLGCLEVRFTGGEPLLRRDFEEIYLSARRLGMKVLLFTNARLIDVRLAEMFADTPPLSPIEVSVYGMHAASYEAVSRVRGSFAQFRRGVDLLFRYGIPFVVKAALLPPNQAELEQFESWASTIPWMKNPPGLAMYLDLRGRRDSADANNRIRALRIPPEQGLAVQTRRAAAWRRGKVEFCRSFMRPAGTRIFACGAGKGGCVDAYGRYQPCLDLRAPELAYDLRSGSLRDALINFFPRLSEMTSSNPEYVSRCAVCFLKGLCDQCPAKSWAEHGTLDTPVEYFCQVAHAQARYLGLLGPDEHAWEIADCIPRIRGLQSATDNRS